jgi:hypothetical protein
MVCNTVRPKGGTVVGQMLEMSMEEADRLKVIWQVITGKLGIKEAAEQLFLSCRQVIRIRNRVKAEGNKGIVHRMRGKPSNHRLPEDLLQQAIAIVREKYWDFGPTFANEYLRNRHSIVISTNTLRKEMIGSEIWKPRKRKTKHRSFRPRRACRGEMIQLDGSIHDWFEKRGRRCVLLTYVDDATSRIEYAEFVDAETTLNLMHSTKKYLEIHGRPVSFYVDKDSIFRANRQANIDEQLRDIQPMTQFSRGMEELGIKVIFAHSPQAKGRVERGFATHQDRLVKELRIQGICAIPEANKYLQNVYVCGHNARFAVKPSNRTDAHRSLLKIHNLQQILSLRTERILGNDFTIRFLNQFFQILPTKLCNLRPKAKICVEIQLDGSIHLKYHNQYLNYKTIEKARRPSKIMNVGKGNRIPKKVALDHPARKFLISEKSINSAFVPGQPR